MSTIYTVGNGKRTQFAKRDDGVWFVRKTFKGQWGKWIEHGRTIPYATGYYIAPRCGCAKLPLT